MSQAKKLMRARFNETSLKRDRYTCRVCVKPTPKAEQDSLEVHHITDRNLMPKGGYVKENGISLCPPHHVEAEDGRPSAEDLYRLIGSSYELALRASERL